MKITLSNMGKAGLGAAGAAALGFLIVVGGPPKPKRPNVIPPAGTTYYVRTDGHNGNHAQPCNGTVNVAYSVGVAPNCAWQTIDYPVDPATLAPGDTVRVQAGFYNETATANNSGSAGNPITLVADGVVSTCGMTFTNVSYLRVIGFTISGTAGGGCLESGFRIAITGTNTGLEFWNNNVSNSLTNAYNMPFTTDRCNSCIVIGGEITEMGDPTPAYGIVLVGDDQFIGYVKIHSGLDYLGVVTSGHRSRFVNLNFQDLVQVGERHPDNFFPQGNTFGWSNNLIESVYGIGSVDAEDNKFMHVSNQTGSITWEKNIFRFNVAYNLGSGFYSVYALSGDIFETHFYHNTIVKCSQNATTTPTCGNIAAQEAFDNTATVHNSIHDEAWTPDVTTNLRPYTETTGVEGGVATVTGDYNLADDRSATVTFTAPWTEQANPRNNIDPKFVNGDSDWTLQSDSGAIGTAGPLTAAVGAGVSSTSLTVPAGRGSMFIGSNASNLPQYGGALVPGDPIGIGANCRTVVSVSGDVITLDSAATWSDGAPVYFGCDTTPDIGAYPYKSGGYTLTATYSGSSTKTIVPNDASLVRFVVCFNSGVPYAVDNSSPFTCSAPSGTFSARAYPRYPSATLWAEATP